MLDTLFSFSIPILFVLYVLKDAIKSLPRMLKRHKRFKIGEYYVKVSLDEAEEFEDQIAMLDVYTSLMEVKKEIYRMQHIYPTLIMYSVGEYKNEITLELRRFWFSEKLNRISILSGIPLVEDFTTKDSYMLKPGAKLHNIDILKKFVNHVQNEK